MCYDPCNSYECNFGSYEGYECPFTHLLEWNLHTALFEENLIPLDFEECYKELHNHCEYELVPAGPP